MHTHAHLFARKSHVCARHLTSPVPPSVRTGPSGCLAGVPSGALDPASHKGVHTGAWTGEWPSLLPVGRPSLANAASHACMLD